MSDEVQKTSLTASPCGSTGSEITFNTQLNASQEFDVCKEHVIIEGDEIFQGNFIEQSLPNTHTQVFLDDDDSDEIIISSDLIHHIGPSLFDLAPTKKSGYFDFAELEGNYKIVEKIGEGTFSSVYSAVSLKSKDPELLALKRIYPTCSPQRILNEIQLLVSLKGKWHVPPVLDILRKRDQVTIVMPYLPHQNFKEYLPNLGVNQIRDYMKALFEALCHLHGNGIIHRDIKPGNFLYNTEEGKFMLVDFGLAQRETKPTPRKSSQPSNLSSLSSQLAPLKRKRNEKDIPLGKRPKNDSLRSSLDRSSSTKRKTEKKAMCAPRGGTRGFRAPEVVLKCKEQTSAIDIWSAGVILLSLLSTRYPFFSSPDDLHSLAEIAAVFGTAELKQKALQMGRRLHLPSDPRVIPKQDLKSLCTRLSSRKDPVPDSAYDLLDRCLDIFPVSRISAAEALQHPFLTDDLLESEEESL